MKTLTALKRRIPRNVLKVLVVVEVMATVELLTHEPAAVAGAFAVVTSLLYRATAMRCFGR